MLTGPRSLDQLEPHHHFITTEEPLQKDVPRPQKRIDWQKEIESLKVKAFGSPQKDRRLMDITIKVSYTDNVDTILTVVKRVLKDTENILREPEPELALGDMDSSVIQIHVKPWCIKDDYWDVLTKLVKNLKYNLYRKGISYRSVKTNA